MQGLMDEVLADTLDPSSVFDLKVDLGGVYDGCDDGPARGSQDPEEGGELTRSQSPGEGEVLHSRHLGAEPVRSASVFAHFGHRTGQKVPPDC